MPEQYTFYQIFLSWKSWELAKTCLWCYHLFMKIYTKTGDDGTTSLCDGKRVSKSSLRVNAYGDIDELSSFLGLAASFTKDKRLKYLLQEISSSMLNRVY